MSPVRILFTACLVLAFGSAQAGAATTAQAVPETMDMLSHAIAFQTVRGHGEVPAFARYLAAKLESAGFAKSDIEIIPVGETAAMAVRYRGSGQAKPILLLGHMDVVPAAPEGWWNHTPFKLVEKDGYLYGRGVADMKTSVVTLVATFMRLKREGFVPKREMVLLLTGGEESDPASTLELVKRYHDAEFALNADSVGGGILNAQGKPVIFQVATAEKTYADFELSATSPGGHSSEPNPPQNPIYRLARALDRLAAYQFPVQHSESTLASLKAIGTHGSGPLATAMRQFAAHPDDAQAAATISADPAFVGQLRTTCVATVFDSGRAHNALPQLATANVNCRVWPGVSGDTVRSTLSQVVADPAVKVAGPSTFTMGPASPVLPGLMDAIAATIHERYPAVDVVPSMSAGATDSKFFRKVGVPSYGVFPVFSRPNDIHMHGVDERILASEVPASLDFWHGLLTRLSR